MNHHRLHSLLIEAAHEAERKAKRAPHNTASRLTALSADLREKAHDVLSFELGRRKETLAGFVGAALLLLLCLMPSVAHAQHLLADPMANARLFPMAYIDEGSMIVSEYPLITFDEDDWQAAKACAARHGVDTAGAIKPDLRVVPLAHTIRVEDLTVDSIVNLATAGDTMKAEGIGRFSAPTIAYTLLRKNLVLITRDANLPGIRQHEALHALMWQAYPRQRVWEERFLAGDWHPLDLFGNCAPGFAAPGQ